MATIDSIEKEIAELEKQQKDAQSKLNRLRKTKQKLIEQSEIDQKASDLQTIEELIKSANKSANEHSVRFEKDEDLDAIFILVNDKYVSETISLESSTFDRVSRTIMLFVRNAEALSTIDRDFNEDDVLRLNYDWKDLEYVSVESNIGDTSIEIFSHASNRISVTARKDLTYANGSVLIRAGKLTYEVSLYDSYDSFSIDAFESKDCSIDNLTQTVYQLVNDVSEAYVIEED